MLTDLCRRVEQQLPRLATAMVAAFVAEVPYYRRLPPEQLHGEVTALCAGSVGALLSAVRADRGPTEHDLAVNRASAARRAREEVPLDALLAAYLIGGRLAWRALVSAATPGEAAELLDAADLVQLSVQRMSGAVTAAYLREQELLASARRDTRRELARALLAGTPPPEGTPALPDHGWLVLAVALGPHPDELVSTLDARVAARRKLRRVLDALDTAGGAPEPGAGTADDPAVAARPGGPGDGDPPGRTLPVLDVTGGVVLLGPGADPDAVVAALRAAAGAPVQAAAVLAPDPAGVPAAYALAAALLPYGTTGVATLARCAVDLQLRAPGDARTYLAGTVAPLRPQLVATVRAWLDADLDRRAAAAALHIHPNTLDYRLRRVHAVTGHDPSSLRGLVALQVGLAASGPGAGA